MKRDASSLHSMIRVVTGVMEWSANSEMENIYVVNRRWSVLGRMGGGSGIRSSMYVVPVGICLSHEYL